MKPAAVAVALLVVLALSGCGPTGPLPMFTKASTVADAVSGLPGVTEVQPTSVEETNYTAPAADLYVRVDDDISEAQLASVLTAFGDADRQSGQDVVFSRLDLYFGEDTTNEIVAENGVLTEEYAGQLATTIGQLRQDYDSAVLSVDPTGWSLSLVLGGEPTLLRDLTALHDARELVEQLGTVRAFDEVDGRFRTEDGLPDDAWLAFLQGFAETVPDLRGVYYGQDQSFSLVTDELSTLAVLDAIPADAPPFDIAFGDDIFFDNRNCDAWYLLEADDPSIPLLTYWTADGRTLLDGSTAADCLSS